EISSIIDFMATPKRIAIVGGGLAGLAAAAALAERGLQVELFEARKHLGGRATSFHDPTTEALVDHCQHVGMGCCTNLTDFCRRVGIVDWMKRHTQLNFIGPNGRRCTVAASRWLPAPMHLLPSLLRLNYLSWRERMAVIRVMRKLVREPESEWGIGNRELEGRKRTDIPSSATIGKWLREHGQTERAIELFWTPVIVSALSETIDRVAVPPVRKVFADAFLGARHGYELQIPTIPLGQLYGERLESWFAQHGAKLRTGCPVRQLIGDAETIRGIEFADGSEDFDAVVLAVPWRRVGKLLPDPLRSALPELRGIDQIESAPITAVHLWFDRPITDLSHVVLPGRLSQWAFNRGQQRLPGENLDAKLPDRAVLDHTATAPKQSPAMTHYYQVVISASQNLSNMPREEIVETVRCELTEVWPAARTAKVLQSRLITQQHAVFSVLPGVDSLRPPQKTSIPNLFLAGDWTATGWPATMEGAVRSGYLAAEAVLVHFEQPAKIVVSDLPKPWLAKWIFG
ncbi:MAG TPA: hydroxysqualene dehydroxylase HpnE, partial [Pirellulales bacterium]